MEYYKQINKQLIDSNRELKINCANIQKEVVQLRVHLLEEHRLRVESERNLRERLVMLLAHNFRTALEEINPNIGILDALGFNNDDGGGSRTNGRGVSTHCRQSGSESEYSRRSSEIVDEFRRSSAFHRRQSVVQMSPVRRSQSCSSVESTSEVESNEAVIEVSNSPEAVAIFDVKTENNGLGLIREETEDDREGNLISATLRSLRVSQEQSTNITSSDPLSPLRDEYSKNPFVVNKRGRILKQKNWLNESERSIEEIRCSVGGKANGNSFHDNQLDIYSDTDRTITPQKYDHLLINKTGVDSIVNRSPSLPLSEMSMRNFSEAPCSTPRSMTTMLSNVVVSYSLQTTNDGGISNNYLTETIQTSEGTRPRRKCAPKSLAEPKLVTKLRNDTVKKTKKRKK